MAFGFQFKRRTPGKGRTAKRVPGTMNKTEERYEREVLIPLFQTQAVIWYGFEAMTFKLADDLRYTPDFAVQLADGTMEFHEVKAGKKDGKVLCEDDALVKIKASPVRFPFTFRMRWFSKPQNQWVERVFE